MANRNRWKPGIAGYEERWSASFPEPIIEDKNKLKSKYRRKLAHRIADARSFCSPTPARPFGLPILMRSVEGIGKSSALRGNLWGEAFDHALGDIGSKSKSVAFAYRSREQARQKAAEFSQRRFPTVAIMPLWEHLNEICDEFREDRIEREQLDSRKLCEMLTEISILNPQVYAELEQRRKAIWSQYPFDGTTLIAMTHRAAQLWPHTTHPCALGIIPTSIPRATTLRWKFSRKNLIYWQSYSMTPSSPISFILFQINFIHN